MDLSLAANWSQILSCFVGAVGLIVAALALWYTRRDRQRRALACEFQSIEFPIEVKAGEAYKGDLEIRYKGEAIENLFLVRVRLTNTGNVPILDSEVVEPLIFEFDSGTALIHPPTVIDRRPENLKTSWDPLEDLDLPRFDAAGWLLEFDLLNPGDEFTAEFLCTGKVALPKVTARIEGISEIGVLSPGKMKMRQELAFEWKVSLLLSVLGAILGIILVYQGWRSGKLFFLVTGTGLAVVILVISVAYWGDYLRRVITARRIMRK